MAKFNDLDLKKWKEYSDIYTDSLWLISKRDNSGTHNGSYHGNFVPQIPHQLFSRYTKENDTILDPFMGSGTSLIEAKKMGRNAIGIDLQKEVVEEAKKRIEQEMGTSFVKTLVGDSKTIDLGSTTVQFVIFHPPYWDIIKFSEDPNDLSNAKSLEEFLSSFAEVIDHTTEVLEPGRYCAVVIGDKYANKQIVPLGFHCMNLFLERKFILKAILVKNFEETKGKANQQGIWRYRALASDFYVFKHEYIFVFKKDVKKNRK